MKQKMKIFNVNFCMLICLAPVVLRADDDTECGYFNPAFGLCSVHSHNIAALDSTTQLPINPTKSEETAQMNEVIAMKSTIIAQQLKEQYDQLNAVVKRFKTQLEKAVLTSKIEVLTGNAASGNSGGGASSSYNNNGLANAENCDSYTGVNLYDCLVRNLGKVAAALDNDTQNAKKQLEFDISIADDYKMCGSVKCSEEITDCKNIKYASDRKKLKSCVTSLQRNVNKARTEYENDNAQARWGR